MKKVALAIALAALMMFGGLSPAAAFKAPDEEVGIDEADSANLSTPPGLETIHKGNLNLAAKGAVAQAGIDAIDDLMKAAGCEAVLKRIQTDNLGYQHIRLTQRYKGLPVVGAELIVHINNQNVIYQINGKYLSSIEVSVEAKIDADAALQIGLDEHQGKTGLRVSKEPSLVIYGPYLAYHYVISYEGEDVGQWWYYVDAHTGKLLFHYNNIKPGAPNSSLGHHDTVQGDRLTGEDGASMSMTGFYEDLGSGNYFLYNFDDIWGIYDETAGDW
jgi:Zn-dependent metalloprotease